MQPAYANRNCFLADSGPRANNRFFSASERLGCARFLNAAAADSVLQCARGSRPRKKLRKQQRVVASGGEKKLRRYTATGRSSGNLLGRCWFALDVTGIR